MVLIAIVEDSHADALVLEEYVERHLREENIPCVIHRYTSGVEFIRSRTVYNVVLMNTHLNDMDGLEAARFLRIVNKDAKLILMSDSMQMAIYGYEAEALDFIVKPVNELTVKRSLDKVMKQMDRNGGDAFALKTRQGIVSMKTSNIYYVEVYDHDLVYHTDKGDFKVRGRLGDVHQQLGNCLFLQCSRSYLVNVRHIESLHRDYLVVNGTEIQIAKSHHKRIEQSFVEYYEKCV